MPRVPEALLTASTVPSSRALRQGLATPCVAPRAPWWREACQEESMRLNFGGRLLATGGHRAGASSGLGRGRRHQMPSEPRWELGYRLTAPGWEHAGQATRTWENIPESTVHTPRTQQAPIPQDQGLDLTLIESPTGLGPPCS
ncbi:hypothetical protein TREES_T100013403 [Tupaia chinensis]|uniref:Uncharacterized protein n=1 Tax=Tupaia chinensis TaxID=246437 RepID=L9JBF5_TUPCH|nr:hypothetical protein TREES_T100013403 [Tupaia chinensis]